MKRLALAAAALAALVAAVVSCEDDPRYVYSARRYDAAKGCLDPYRGVETIRGDNVSVRCSQACLTVGDTVYVSPVCPPLPENATALEESAPECQAALDASRMDASCGESVEEDEDGGDEEDAAALEDASEDAGIVLDAAEEG